MKGLSSSIKSLVLLFFMIFIIAAGVPNAYADSDGDGFDPPADCNDTDPNIYPGAPELCDGLDNDCNYSLPSNERDRDGDTYLQCAECNDYNAAVNPGQTEILCNNIDDDCNPLTADCTGQDNDGDGSVTPADCNDGDATVYPGAPELCDGLDNNCDTVIPANETDGDSDGSRICDGDCNDADPNTRPGAAELCDGLDNNCDTVIPANESDGDSDGFRICDGDCNDADPAVNPAGVEGPFGNATCSDGLDNNCDGQTDAADAGCADPCTDNDGDGYGNPGDASCANGSATDCDDTNAAVNPGASEIQCNGLDDDCNPATSDGTVCNDIDGDGFDTPADCDDTDPNIYPGAPELCDGLDNDCNYNLPSNERDRDGDTYLQCAECNDYNAGINPGIPEICGDGIDQNCDGVDDPCTGAIDYPTQIQPIWDGSCTSCHSTGGTSPDLSPANSYASIVGITAALCPTEVYVIPSNSAASYLWAKVNPDGITPACGGKMPPNTSGISQGQADLFALWIDQGATPSTTCADLDGDGYGTPGNTNCPNGGALDCDDANAAVFPGAAEVCDDTIDNDCDALVDCLDNADCSSFPACAAAPLLGTDVTSIDFGVVTIPNTGNANVRVTSTGTADVNITAVGTDNTVFGVTTLAMVLTPGSFVDIPVTFTPTAAGVQNGALTIASDAQNDPVTVSLTGEGFDPNAPIPYTDVQAIFDANCISCHGAASPAAGLDLTAGCDSLASGSRVVAGDSANSVLSQKVNGGSMSVYLSATEAQTIGTWIDQGADCPCIDNDVDGYGSNGSSLCPNGTAVDCDDTDNAVNPGATEVCDDTIDNNCDTLADCADASCSTFPACSAVPLLGTDVTSIDFGVVTIPNTGNASVRVTSTGTADVNITAVGTDNTVFGVTTLAMVLTPGSFVDIPVTFTPVAGGIQNGALTITSDANNDPVTVSLTGEGFDPNAPIPYTDIQTIFDTGCISCHSGASPSAGLDLTASCESLVSGSRVVVGDSANSVLFQKVNGGSMSSYLSATEAQTIGTWIDQGANCPCVDNDIDGYGANGSNDCPNGTAVDCDDTNIAVNPGAAEVCDDFIDNDCDILADCADTVDCSSFPACASVATIVTDITSINYGVVVVGNSATANVLISNVGTANLTISGWSADNSVFTIGAGAPGLPQVLAPSASVSLPVDYTPVAASVDNGTLTITSNAGNGDATVSLTGTGATDNDSDGYDSTVDCDDNNPNVNPGAPEVLGNSKDDDCDAATLDDGGVMTGTPPAPHNALNCSDCHLANFADPIPDSKCDQCHTPGGALKGSYPTAPDVLSHTDVSGSGAYLYTNACVDCHNPMATALPNIKLLRSAVSGSVTPGSVINFTSPTGAGSFADGAPYAENVCETCHSQTNHHWYDGNGPSDNNAGGYVGHKDTGDCTTCHAHGNAFLPTLTPPPAPHDTFACSVCHVTNDTYIVNANIPSTACDACHAPGSPDAASGGSDLNVVEHFSDTYTDPQTGQLLSLNCVECHNPMSDQMNFRNNTNLKFIRSVIRGADVAFETTTGQYSFADDTNMPVDMATENYLCNTCHTQTNHHQNDGTAPGLQSHNDGQDCTTCHAHNGGFQPPVVTLPPPHNALACTACHVTPDTYVPNAAIPNTACEACHGLGSAGTGAGGSDLNVDTHYSGGYTDPQTGQLLSLNCVECHNPMDFQVNFRGNTNLKFIRSAIRGNNVAFEATTGQYSFADDTNIPVDMAPQNYLCNTCHTQTVHHRGDGTLPAFDQSHNDGTDCTSCHTHDGGFQPPAGGGDCLSCHNQSPPVGSSDANRRQIVEGTPGDGSGDFVRTSHHVTDGTSNQLVIQDDCLICHDQAQHQTFGDGVSVLLTDQDGGASYTYNGNPLTAENFCLSCHDGNHSTPFPSDGNSPANIENGWLSSSHQASGSATCLDCHDQGHGSDFDKILSEANGPGICFNCHDSNGPASDDIQSEFNKTYGHNSSLCLNCHNPHKAKSGTHTAGNPALAGVLTGVSGADGSSGSNWPATGNPPRSNFSYNVVSTPTREYQVCYKCHSYFNTGVLNQGGSGALAHTDVGLEFNPNNTSYHPVAQALPSSQRLTSKQLTNGWSPGDTMTCSDCHANNSSSPKGPHGSSIKWMLAGTNKAWPYQSASSNGTSSGTFFYYGGTRNNLFCANCHPDTGKNGNAENKVHEKGDHNGSTDGRCLNCHIRVPHGGKVSRLISANNNGTLPSRYYPDGNGGGTVYLRKFTRSSDPTNYNTNNCYSTINACDKHKSSGNGNESW